MRVFAISDLHTDFQDNLRLLEQLSARAYRQDVLLLAGDIADRLEVIGHTLALLAAKFARVYYTPGNHELWVRREKYDSIEKYYRIVELCEQLGVGTRPGREGQVQIVPLLSWYDSDYSLNADLEGSELEGWADFHFCKWPDKIESPSAFFLSQNEPHIRSYSKPVLSLSHFAPRADLLPPASALRFKQLPEVSICPPLDEQIRRLGSVVHVFGHTHIDCDINIESVRYVQNALKYPKERPRSRPLLKLVWHSG